MDYEFESSTRWSKGVDTHHLIDLDLDLAVIDILRSSFDLRKRLALTEGEIRKAIFTLVTEKIVPQIIRETGVNSDQPEGKVETKAHSKINSHARTFIPTRPEKSLFIIDQMQIRLDLKTDRPLNAIQALYAHRGGLASDITNQVMGNLKRAVLNTHDTSTRSRWSLTGDTVDSFQHEVYESSAEDN